MLVHTHLYVYICLTTTLTPIHTTFRIFQRFSISGWLTNINFSNDADSLSLSARSCVCAHVCEINANIDISNIYLQIHIQTWLNWRKKETRKQIRKSEIETSRDETKERRKKNRQRAQHMRILHIRRSTYNRLWKLWPRVCV